MLQEVNQIPLLAPTDQLKVINLGLPARNLKHLEVQIELQSQGIILPYIH